VNPYVRPETRPETKRTEAKIFQMMQDLPFLSGFDDVSTGEWDGRIHWKKSVINI
jgi:hypothetical protein